MLVKEGDQINKGQVVLVLEAMKMETEVQSLESGIVTTIHVSEGAEVAVDEIMISLS